MIQLSIVSNPSFFTLKNLAVFYRTFPDICLGQVWALLWCIGGHRNNKLSCFLFGFPYVMSGISHLLISVSLFCINLLHMYARFFFLGFVFVLSVIIAIKGQWRWGLVIIQVGIRTRTLDFRKASQFQLFSVCHFLRRSNYVFHWV